MKMQKLFNKRCPKCGKEISSLSKGQFEYNFNEHLKSHKRKENKK